MNKVDRISREQVQKLFNLPLLDLLQEATELHRKYFPERKIYLNTLISYKTGACFEDCAYCAQSSRYNSKIEAVGYIKEKEILAQAEKAKAQGSSRVCISASWKEVSEGKHFETILSAGRKIREMGLDVCATLGFVSVEQLKKLMDNGFSAYNHNVDTSESFYPNIITTRNYIDRLKTLQRIQKTGLNCCSGGIIGMGESENDRIDMLHVLANREKALFTFPINVLVPIPGTPLESMPPIEIWELLRIIAVGRILMPQTRICLAAGRVQMNDEALALSYMAGANAVFAGEKLLTTENTDIDKDLQLFNKLGLKIG
ncbi:MAG: biotin synthase BioB [Bacteroidota bacterium]|nr:biotin synthase BioB [Bacteroidota bacterium]